MPDWLFIGLRLTGLGMGLVFLLLGLLWGIIALLARVDPAARPVAQARVSVRADDGQAVEPELAAAVMIAVRAHIRSRRKQAAPAMRAHAPGSLPSRWVNVGRTRQTRTWPIGGGRRD